MKIDSDQVHRVATLARLEASDSEIEQLRDDMNNILEYFEEIADISLAGVEPTTHALPVDCPERDDAVVPSTGRASLLSPAPSHDDAFFMVPKIIEQLP